MGSRLGAPMAPAAHPVSGVCPISSCTQGGQCVGRLAPHLGVPATCEPPPPATSHRVCGTGSCGGILETKGALAAAKGLQPGPGFMMLCPQHWAPGAVGGVCLSSVCGVIAFAILWVPGCVPHNGVTLCLTFCGTCLGACVLRASLGLEACV